jgi:hypothetical protein
MTLDKLVAWASNKAKFTNIENYRDFCLEFLDFISQAGSIQADIVARNEPQYHFFQFKNKAFTISRPVNYDLFYGAKEAENKIEKFLGVLRNVRGSDTKENRDIVNRAVYTIQQTIGCALDGLPVGASNRARKVNGDLFEHFIRLILQRVGIECTSGVFHVPIKVDHDEFPMSYQHDLIIKSGELVKIIGSVKTSSKDRLDKIFVDKFLLAKLTGKDIPHVAIFLNDVQRKGKHPNYGINATFLPGHFKGYTIKLNPLDGVYYFDIRPNMLTESILKNHIRRFDNFLFTELWTLLDREAIVAKVKEGASDE